ncbi:WecB/TagA/CpsF family glycosyltransferase [Microbacterium sp. BWR-S6Y]|uniref:WecB/TagA/CpsF family glycosyltransferase n=1 Tax=Microbacterium sp. BWR-S6Y TaxID=3232073 RepID=UPI0035270B88
MKSVALPWGLGTVTPLDVEQTCDWILDAAPSRQQPRILANLNLHALHLTLEEGPVKRLTAVSDVTLIDGWPILLLARFTTASAKWPTSRERIGSTDWLEELFSRDPALRVVAVGGTSETAAKMSSHVNDNTHNIQWRHFDGFRFQENGNAHSQRTLDDALANADLVLVGLGMPTQEAWILDHLDAIGDGAVVANVGGCFDYFAGSQQLAPRWMGRVGLEWLYRLAHSPRRLAKRYLVEPFLLLTRVFRHKFQSHE